MLSFVSALLLLVLVITIFLYSTRNFNYWKSRDVPHQKPEFWLTSLKNLIWGDDFIGKYIGKLYQQFEGPYFGMYALNRPCLVLKDPDLIKRILVKDFSSFPDRMLYSDENLDPIVSSSLISLKAPHWKFLREKLSIAFTSGNIKMKLLLMKKCAGNLKTHIEDVLDKNVEVKEIVARYVTDALASCAFGLTVNSLKNENSKFTEAGKGLFEGTPFTTFQRLSYFFDPLAAKIFKFGLFPAEPAEFLRQTFMNTIDERETRKINQNDIIDILIKMKNNGINEKFKMYDHRLTAQAVTIFSAGYEATGSTTAFMLHELCLNMEIQDRIRKEIQEKLKEHGNLTYEAIQDMKYLHMVVQETLRKYPLIPFIHRECVKDYQIPETGLLVEKGTAIIIPQHGLQLDAKYFPEPEKFDPERFNEQNKLKVNPNIYLPFGDGPRNCVGGRLGLIILKVCVVSILKNFKIERNAYTKDPLDFKPSPILHAKGGLPVTFRRL